MSKDKLQHSGNNQSLKVARENKTVLNNVDSKEIYYDNTNNGQLRSTPKDESAAYRSEEHRQSLRNVTYSFDEQRDNYAEQALNAPPPTGYDYHASEPDTEDKHDYYQRYTKGKESGMDGTDTVDSIFTASDYELANATEDYLPQNSADFSNKIEQFDRRIEKTADKIDSLETYSQRKKSYKPWKRRLINDKKNTLQHNRQKGSKLTIRNNTGRMHQNAAAGGGRLKFRNGSGTLRDSGYFRSVKREEWRADRNTYIRRQLQDRVRQIAQGSEFEEDEISAEMRRKGRMVTRGAEWTAKRNTRRLKHSLDGRNRLQFQQARLASLQTQQDLTYQSGINRQKRKSEEAARQGFIKEKQKRKKKKEMVRNYKREQGNFFTRSKNQQKLKKTVKKEQKIAQKRAKTMISSIAGVVILILLILLIFFTLSAVLLDMGGESVANVVSQNDYSKMTEVTAYFRENEAELEEYIQPENLEPIILEEYPEIYEFIYDMAEISFDANTLVAYLSAKYNEFTLDMVRADLDEIFEQYYNLDWEVKEEYRLVTDTTQPIDPVTGHHPKVNKLVQICYVKLEKQDFYELTKSHIEDAAKQTQMDGFYLAGNGQQVYQPVMQVDWRKKISSNYGWRIHPITGVRTFHDGVDIAIPTGTALYSPIKGTVIQSSYSDSAGNMIVMQTDSGWQITFMHMDSRTISAGESIMPGTLMGYSGNTGNSTGPHLHLRVHDAEGNPINPVFIVPFSTIEASETF